MPLQEGVLPREIRESNTVGRENPPAVYQPNYAAKRENFDIFYNIFIHSPDYVALIPLLGRHYRDRKEPHDASHTTVHTDAFKF
jgi:hypothetical protein